MSTCFPCMEGDHQNCGRGNRVDMLECRCDERTPDCPGQVLQRSRNRPGGDAGEGEPSHQPSIQQWCGYDRRFQKSTDAADNAAERIKLARRALVADGYFTADQVDDDVAPRISELSSHLRQRIRELEAQLPSPSGAPRGCDIEILERTSRSGIEDGSGVLIPNAVRINGIPTLAPADSPIRVHELIGDDVVRVTLTVFARSIRIGAEAIDEPAEIGK